METERGPIRYELKNWAKWHYWSDKAFQNQFLKDLAVMTQGRRVKWVFSGEKMSREEILTHIFDLLKSEQFKLRVQSLHLSPSEMKTLAEVLGFKVKRNYKIEDILEHRSAIESILEIIE